MDRLKRALEILDEAISDLEDKIGLDTGARRESSRKQMDALKTSRAREAGVLAVAQKVASRLDQAIEHVEQIVRRSMSKISITLFGKDYNVTCGVGEETRLRELVRFVEGKMREVSSRAGNTTEPRLFMLTCLHMADELFELRRKMEENALQDEDLLVAAVEHLGERIGHIASQVGRA